MMCLIFPSIATQRGMQCGGGGVSVVSANQQDGNYCNFDNTAGLTIPDTATAVAWCDGDMSQIDAIKRSVDLYVENKIVANKQNAARSGVEQPADLARVFKSIKRIQSEHTLIRP